MATRSDAPARSASDRVAVAPEAEVLVTPSGGGYLVLHAGPERPADGAAWDIVYLAGAQGWAPSQARRGSAGQIPVVQTRIVRDAGEEASARDAAGAFLNDLDRGDYDAAWASTSALLKAAMSRAEFQRQFAAVPRGEAHAGKLYLSFSAPAEQFLPGASMQAWDAATEATRAVRTVQLRLDDDMVWRVAGVTAVKIRPAGVLAVRGVTAARPRSASVRAVRPAGTA